MGMAQGGGVGWGMSRCIKLLWHEQFCILFFKLIYSSNFTEVLV